MNGGFSALEERVLGALLCLFPPGPVSDASLVRLFRGSAAPAEWRAELLKLQRTGDVRAFDRAPGERLYAAAAGRQPELSFRLFGAPSSAGTAVDVKASSSAGQDIVFDLLRLVQHIDLNRPELTRKGAVPKAVARQWDRIARLSSPAAGRMLERLRAPSAGAQAGVLLLDLAMRAGLVRLADHAVVPDAEALSGWLSRPDARRMLHAVWVNAYPPADPLVRLIAYVLPYMPAGWFSVSDLLTWWSEQAGRLAATGETPSMRSLAEEAELWSELGWAETGRTPAGDFVFRVRAESFAPANMEQPELYVQPDLEVFAPADSLPAVHYWLMMIGEPVKFDRMAIYRLARSSLQRAYACGLTADGVVRVLDARSRSGVPETVRAAVSEWERSDAELEVEDAVIVRFAGGEEANLFARMDGLSKWMRTDNRLQENAYALTRQEYEQWTEALKRLDVRVRQIEPRSGRKADGGRGTEPDQRGSGERSERYAQLERCLTGESGDGGAAMPRDALQLCKGLFPSPCDAHSDVQQAADGGAEQLYPGLSRIPLQWRREARSYHPSTMQKLVEQAIRWGCCVSVQTKGRRCRVAPEALDKVDGRAAVEGWMDGEAVRIYIDEMETIQLEVPGLDG